MITKQQNTILLACSLALTAPALATNILESADGSGFTPRFGLLSNGVTTVDTTVDMAQHIIGDPNAGFSDYLGPNFLPLVPEDAAYLAKSGDLITVSYEVYVPIGAIGITGTGVQMRYYGDEGEPGVQFGEGGDFNTRIEAFGPVLDLTDPNNAENRGLWVPVSFTSFIPALSTNSTPISHFGLGLRMLQDGESNDQAVNTVVADANLWIRNINIELTESATPEPGSYFSSAFGAGLQARFGLSTDEGIVEIEATGDRAQKITGDPFKPFSDLTGSFFDSLAATGLKPGDEFTFTYEVYLPAGDPGISDCNAQFRFYSDTGGEGLQFGDMSDFNDRIEIFGAGFDREIRETWQTVTVTANIPLVDMADLPITHFGYKVTAPQFAIGDQPAEIDDAANDVIAPVCFYLRNISLTFPSLIPAPTEVKVTDTFYNTNDNSFSFEFSSLENRTYTVQYIDILEGDDGNWTNVIPDIVGEEGENSSVFKDPGLTDTPNRFYRVLLKR